MGLRPIAVVQNTGAEPPPAGGTSSRFSAGMRAVALVALLVFAAACTRTVPRGSLETRQFNLDWESLETQRVVINGLVMEGVPLTPAQWPLEASLKKLFQADFVGVIEEFDLSFRPSNLPGDMLEKLNDEGFLAVLVRVTNAGDEPVHFQPDLALIRADDDTFFYPVTAEELPARFKEVDWAQTGLGVVVAALYLIVILASLKNNSRPPRVGHLMEISIQGGSGGRGAYTAPASYGATSNKGILQPGMMAPAEVREGFIFFQLDQTVVDWGTVRLDTP